MSADEQVLCVKSRLVDGILDADAALDEKLETLLSCKTYRNRKTPNDDGPCAEEDERYRQLIPYIAVFDERGQILAYNRGDKGGENRLRGRWAIGFGGHVNSDDNGWLGGIVRELREELGITEPIGLTGATPRDGEWIPLQGPLGFLRDDSNAVGRCHLGVLYSITASKVIPREGVEWTWSSVGLIERLAEKNPDKLETWSRMALDMLKGGA